MALRRLIAVVAILAFSWSCGSSPTKPSMSGATVSSVVVTGTTNLSSAGQTSQLTATATFSDGTTQNVTATATWQSSNSGSATVSSGGLVTALASGTVTITAIYQGKSGTATIVMSFSASTKSTMTATIDGAPFTALVVTTIKTPLPNLPSGILGVNGTSGFATPYLILGFAIPATVGTHVLGPGTIPNGTLHQNGAAFSLLWSTLVAGSSGTVTLTTLTATEAAGTFSLTLPPDSGVGGTPTGTKVVANGVFSVTF